MALLIHLSYANSFNSQKFFTWLSQALRFSSVESVIKFTVSETTFKNLSV